MATIRIHNTTEVTGQGTRTRGNAKPVFCITTGEIYTSAADAAEIIGCSQGNVSWAATGRMKTCKGLRLCYIADIVEHLEEIASIARERNVKVVAYDRIAAREEAIRKANENRAIHQAKCEKLRKQLEKEMELLAEAESKVNEFNT